MVCGDVTITLNSVTDSTLLPIGQPGIILDKNTASYITQKTNFYFEVKFSSFNFELIRPLKQFQFYILTE